MAFLGLQETTMLVGGVVRGGVGYCAAGGVRLFTVVSSRLSLSLSLALCNISKAWLWKVTEGAAVAGLAGDGGCVWGRGCISLYIQLKSTIYT